jgi:hypothetical protein
MRLLLPFVLVGALFAGTATAQPVLQPPSGPVAREAPHAKHMHGRHRLPPRVRAALIARFDRDGDGRLTGRERKQAKRFILRMRRHHQQQRAGF